MNIPHPIQNKNHRNAIVLTWFLTVSLTTLLVAMVINHHIGQLPQEAVQRVLILGFLLGALSTTSAIWIAQQHQTPTPTNETPGDQE
jgi:small neutral amino acid transporter SnatA (MarC family)